MGKKMVNAISPHFWSDEEHFRFLEALEKCGHCTPNTAVWTMIADFVGTRNFKDVKLHANRYFLQLQMVNTQKRKEMQAMRAVDRRWTLEEDKLFEELIAVYSNCAFYPWDTIASKFRNKTAKDVRDRYEKLLYDIAIIEKGHQVTMHLSAWSNPNVTVDEKKAENNDKELCIYDCSVTMTTDEEDLLMMALEETIIPPTSSLNMLAVISSAIVAITNHSNKNPPRRTHPAFTKEDAKQAIAKVLLNNNEETPAVLELLINALHLKDGKMVDTKIHNTMSARISNRLNDDVTYMSKNGTINRDLLYQQNAEMDGY